MEIILERKVRDMPERRGLWLKIPSKAVRRLGASSGDSVFWESIAGGGVSARIYGPPPSEQEAS